MRRNNPTGEELDELIEGKRRYVASLVAGAEAGDVQAFREYHSRVLSRDPVDFETDWEEFQQER